MKIKDYKVQIFCFVCNKISFLSRGQEHICKCGEDIFLDTWGFETKDDYDEYRYFSNWQDESCANYVGYLLKLKKFNLIVSRENAAKSGLYNLTKCDSNINSGSDPSGKHPEWFEEISNNIKIKDIKKIVNQYKLYDKSTI